MADVEWRHGAPTAIQVLHVFETDPKILFGQGSGIEVMLAVGNIPASVPAAVLRASLRGQIRTVLSAPQLASAAQAMKVTVEEMQKDPDFKPYFNLKAVLVEEAGALRVAYFEFLPPSMLD